MNVRTIADANLRIMNDVARWPGSMHDNIIFANSEVRQKFEEENLGASSSSAMVDTQIAIICVRHIVRMSS